MNSDAPMSMQSAKRADEKLVRAIGVPALTANIVNTTIGAGIFVLPALVAKGLGAAAPLAFLICAIAMALFVTCFAVAGSRVSLTGGMYAYVEVAFGRYVGFLTGVLFCITAISSVAGVVNLFAGSVAALVPSFGSETGRIVLMVLIYGVLAAINIRGVRAGANAVTGVTLAKLVPLLIFVVAGVFFIQPGAITWPSWPGGEALGESVLLLIFAFAGIEVALIPSGEVKNPARTVPRSIYLALGITTLLYLLIQMVAQGALGNDLANHPTAPLAEAAARFLGDFGRTLLLAGATISAFGFVTSDILSSPRILFAFGRDGVLPAWFAHVHPRFRSPDVAILSYTIVAFALSISSTFAALAVLANVAVLIMYALCAAASWELVRRNIRADGVPFGFPGFKVVPVVALLIIFWILSHATVREFAVTGGVLTAGSVLYFLRRVVEKQRF